MIDQLQPAGSRRRSAALAVGVAALLLAGCGGDDAPTSAAGGKGKPAIGRADGFTAKKSLVPKGDSADADGEVESYVPTGDIIADSGFRPETDGFSFENYGNDVGPENLEPVNVQTLFGNIVCLRGTSEDCRLTPAAKTWMDNQNESMGGGHCQGFSVLALRMFDDKVDESDYGARRTANLDLVGNTDLQSAIAEHFTYQVLPPILEKRVKGTPSQVLQTLVDRLNDGKELYTLGIYKSDFTGGHAITPFAVEDQGDGAYKILVYDNNFPGVTRAVDVNTEDETWDYVGGTNPKNTDEVYEGNARTGTLELDPTRPGEQESSCPFCEATEQTEEGSGKGSVLAEEDRYTELTLTGDPANHPHLVFTDDDGRRTGIVNGRFLREIPDVEVVKTYAVQNWDEAPEPRFRLPEGKEYSITVDGSRLTKATKASVNLVGNGLAIDLDGIEIAPGQKDEMALPGGYGITYQTNSKSEIPTSPEFYAGLVKGNAALNFAATAVGVKSGSTVSFLVDQENEAVILDSTGSEGLEGLKPQFLLQLTKADAKGRVTAWQRLLELDGAKEQKAGFDYSTAPRSGKRLPIVVLDEDAEVIRTLTAKPTTP
ncbi:hypothetical protein [Patulibacter sp.]|uniref:hypothetical protein n=1 Tax=Patulibacter sp. TaxID=1912859 RepID=UPI002721BB9A|nr:hypothetical protein [Patulibacter sp.]MDO9408824.1 hypothetical protein [Patulibacter sp.]